MGFLDSQNPITVTMSTTSTTSGTAQLSEGAPSWSSSRKHLSLFDKTDVSWIYYHHFKQPLSSPPYFVSFPELKGLDSDKLSERDDGVGGEGREGKGELKAFCSGQENFERK